MSASLTNGGTLGLQNFTTLVQNEAAAMQGAATAPLNFDPGSVLRAIVEADASQQLWLQYLILLVLGVVRLATSQGADADSFGADFSFVRLPAVAASGSVTFGRYATGQAAFIPVGAQVVTADGTQTFNVTADTTNAAYVAGPPAGYSIGPTVASVTVPVQAVNAGTQGNVLAGTISLIVAGIAGIDTVTNSAAFTTGVDAETDAAFRARFVNFINSRASGTPTAVSYAVQQIQQGLSWTIQENQTANGTYTPGTFVVTVDNGTGSPPSSLISTAAAAVQLVRPVGSVAVVQGPTEIAATITLTITVSASAVKAQITPLVATAITAYVNGLGVGATLPYSRIAQVAYDASASITNVTAVLVNGATADLVPTQSQVVRIGSVVVS